MEPKPGIPPSPNHVLALIETMRSRDIRLLLAANYFDQHQVRTVASRVNAEPVIVPLYVGGEKGIGTYFDLVDLWINRLLTAARNKQVIR